MGPLCHSCQAPGGPQETSSLFACPGLALWGVQDEALGQSRLKTCSFASRSSPFEEVVQMNFEVASFSSLSGSQPITWQVEYPHGAPSDTTISEVFVSQKDLVGIVPLAMVRRLPQAAPGARWPLCSTVAAIVSGCGLPVLPCPTAISLGRLSSRGSPGPHTKCVSVPALFSWL